METLTLKGLHFRAYHGFFEEERIEGNDFEVDLTVTADFRTSGESDNLHDTIDYQELTDIVESVMNGSPVKLIETLAKQIGDNIFEAFSGINELEVTVRKFRPKLEVEIAYSEIKMTWHR